MALTFQQKQELVALTKERTERSQSLIITHYRGVDVTNLNRLRSLGKSQGVVFQVVRNTLARLAVKGTAFEMLLEHLKGPMMIAYSFEDPAAAARLLKDHLESIEALKVVAFGVGGVDFSGKELDRLATLPTREEALATVARLLKAPIDALAKDLAEVPACLARVLHALKEKN